MRVPPAQQTHPTGGFPVSVTQAHKRPQELEKPTAPGAGELGREPAELGPQVGRRQHPRDAALRLHRCVAKSPGLQPASPRNTRSFCFDARASFAHCAPGPPRPFHSLFHTLF